MSSFNYKIPLQLSKVIEGQEVATCNLINSVTKILELIITTKFGEHRSDPSFGCEIWDLDFELIVSESLWGEKLRKSLIKSITTHEPRLSDIEITVAISDFEKPNFSRQFTEIKKRVDIGIFGTIHKTGEDYSFKTNLFLSPLSVV